MTTSAHSYQHATWFCSAFFYIGTRWRSWSKHCATRQKVAGSISDGVVEIFHWLHPSGRTMALGLTQPLRELNIRDISWEVKAAGADKLPTFVYRLSGNCGSVNLLEPSGLVQACTVIAVPSSFLVSFEIDERSRFIRGFPSKSLRLPCFL